MPASKRLSVRAWKRQSVTALSRSHALTLSRSHAPLPWRGHTGSSLAGIGTAGRGATSTQRLVECGFERFVRHGALDLAQTASYIAHRLKIAGSLSRIFTDDAIELIFKLSRGAPRQINNICDIALMVGYNTRALEIDPKIVADCAETPERASGEEPSESSSLGARPATDDAPPGGRRPVDAAAPKDPWWPHKYL